MALAAIGQSGLFLSSEERRGQSKCWIQWAKAATAKFSKSRQIRYQNAPNLT